MSRRAIIVADDFGRSASVNRAVIEAHRGGMLTCASLMVAGEAWEEAVELAQAHPRLGVGLHVTLACGASALPAERIPGLVNACGELDSSPVRAGLRYWFGTDAQSEMRREVAAQFERFRDTGLTLDHVNGHLNMHLHPGVLPVVLDHAADLGCRAVRLTRDPLALNLRIAGGRLPYRLSHAAVFGCLSGIARGSLEAAGFRFADRVFGLLQSGDMNPRYVEKLLRALPPGDSEIYFHPDWDGAGGNADFQSLTSPALGALLEAEGIELIRGREL